MYKRQDVDDDDIKYVVIFDEGAFFAQKEGLYIGIPLHECVGSLGNDVITYAKVVGNKFDKEKSLSLIHIFALWGKGILCLRHFCCARNMYNKMNFVALQAKSH